MSSFAIMVESNLNSLDFLSFDRKILCEVFPIKSLACCLGRQKIRDLPVNEDQSYCSVYTVK